MSLHTDLLEQASHLSRRERRRPKQASLRRAISAAYYSLFHLLIHDATTLLVSMPAQRTRFARAFDHGTMKNASNRFGSPKLSAQDEQDLTGGGKISADLRDIAEFFAELQEARHAADYDLARTFSRTEVLEFVSRTRQAFQKWQSIREDPAAKAYLAAMLLWKTWSR